MIEQLKVHPSPQVESGIRVLQGEKRPINASRWSRAAARLAQMQRQPQSNSVCHALQPNLPPFHPRFRPRRGLFKGLTRLPDAHNVSDRPPLLFTAFSQKKNEMPALDFQLTPVFAIRLRYL